MTCALCSNAARVHAQIWVLRSAPESTFQTANCHCSGTLVLHCSPAVNRIAHVQDISHHASKYSYGEYATCSGRELRVRPLSLPLLGHFFFFLVFASLYLHFFFNCRITGRKLHNCENRMQGPECGEELQ